MVERKELNKAIYDVITHKYVKECPEAHKIVKEAGYVIKKRDGGFLVKTPNSRDVTGEVRMCVFRSYNNSEITLNYIGGIALTDKIDFVGYLEKADERWNKKVSVSTHGDNESAHSKYRLLKHCKDAFSKHLDYYMYVVKHHESEKEIAWAKTQAESRLKDLCEIRKRYGLLAGNEAIA